MHTITHKPLATPQTTAGLLLSLQSTLPRANALARAARRMAHRLHRTGHPSRSLSLQAADLLASLLDAADDIECDDPDILDPAFDD